MGGPSGGCIPKEHLNVPVDYESLTELGAIMGSGGLIVMDDNTCMVDLARFFLEFVQDESCGKCPPCRIGTKRMLEILERITQGKGEEGDIEKLEKLAYRIKETALCGLGQTAPNPVLSTIRHFREEYEEHIRYKYCRAGVCADLVRAPCQNECPARVDVPGYVSLIAEGRYREALELHRDRNPFPSICARVCMHTCETKCRRTQLDSPVAIRALKRFMADEETEYYSMPLAIDDENRKRHKVAIIGAGPSGLSCAYFLARIGYRPVIFEARPEPGGMLRYGIPEYRLPKKTLSREIGLIQNLGVEIKTGVSMGKDFTIEELKEKGFEAVYLAIGAWQSLQLGLDNENARGVYGALDFLEKTNTGTDLGKLGNVVVIGGGHAAVDSARTAIRLNSDSVALIYRRTREEMPVSSEELEEAEREGVRVKYLVTPMEFIAEDGVLKAVKCANMALGEFDRSGRRRPVAVEESAFELPADTAITAIGQQAKEEAYKGDGSIQLNRNKTVRVDRDNCATSIPYVFAGGDIVRGPASVVHAIADGQKAAACIDQYIMRDPEFRYPWLEEKVLDTKFDPDADPVERPRAQVPTIALSDRRHNFREVEVAITEKQVRLEAERCLRCDYREEP
jgi:NADH-quinone oxidoreductase subunit F